MATTDSPQIDPQTGERIPSGGVQIDPQTGERITSASASAPDDRNGFQKWADSQTRIDPANARPGILGHLATAAGNFGGGVLSPLSLIAHPIQTGKMALNSVNEYQGQPKTFDDTPSMQEGLIRGIMENPSGTLENVAGGLVGGEAMGGIAGAAKPILGRVGESMQRGGEGIINRTIGATKSDFARGANPGQGYFQARLGPSASMGSIAAKAGDALDTTGEAIGSKIDEVDALRQRMGLGPQRIPAITAAKAIGEPINEAHSVLSGPGGGSTAPIEDLSATFRPSLLKATQNGGFTPRELFDLKRNVANNTSWSDPAQIGLKQTRQQIVGGVGGALSDAIPDLKPLNSRYQNLTKLADKADYRANTGISPLTQMGRRGAELALGAGLGYATQHPLLAAAPMALDSVPVRTGLASGLYYGGEALPKVVPVAARLSGPASAISGIANKKPKKESDEEK